MASKFLGLIFGFDNCDVCEKEIVLEALCYHIALRFFRRDYGKIRKLLEKQLSYIQKMNSTPFSLVITTSKRGRLDDYELVSTNIRNPITDFSTRKKQKH